MYGIEDVEKAARRSGCDCNHGRYRYRCWSVCCHGYWCKVRRFTHMACLCDRCYSSDTCRFEHCVSQSYVSSGRRGELCVPYEDCVESGRVSLRLGYVACADRAGGNNCEGVCGVCECSPLDDGAAEYHRFHGGLYWGSSFLRSSTYFRHSYQRRSFHGRNSPVPMLRMLLLPPGTWVPSGLPSSLSLHGPQFCRPTTVSRRLEPVSCSGSHGTKSLEGNWLK
jgi:hypothetical protein